MARKVISCSRGEQRFTVVRVDRDDADSHAAASFKAAMDLAMPDRGQRIDVFVTCAPDAGAARLPSNYLRRGKFMRGFTRG